MGVQPIHVSREAGMQIFQSYGHLGRRLEITVLNFFFLGLFVKVALKLYNGYHFNLVKSKPGARGEMMPS